MKITNQASFQGRWYPRLQAWSVFETFVWSAYREELFIDCTIIGDEEFRAWAEDKAKEAGYEVYG